MSDLWVVKRRNSGGGPVAILFHAEGEVVRRTGVEKVGVSGSLLQM